MQPIFCCGEIEPFKPKRLDHEVKFESFMVWSKLNNLNNVEDHDDECIRTSWDLSTTYVVQIVRQVNYGPQESKRYFLSLNPSNATSTFAEVTERDLIDANYKKLNS